MTKRQMRRMIMLEGMGYAVFTAPSIQMPIVIAIVFIVCTVAPLLAYESSSHDSIVD